METIPYANERKRVDEQLHMLDSLLKKPAKAHRMRPNTPDMVDAMRRLGMHLHAAIEELGGEEALCW